jgi:uncharacterized protein YndB with AHSA1/START domain
VEVSRSIVIARPVEEVFAYLADARNDPEWCPKVISVEQVAGDGPGPGARYRVVHKPVPGRAAREMDHVCLSWRPPSAIEWREQDGVDVLVVTYSLEDLDGITRLTQRSDAELGAPRVLHPLMRVGIGHDVARQLKTLKAGLEAQASGAPVPAHRRREPRSEHSRPREDRP